MMEKTEALKVPKVRGKILLLCIIIIATMVSMKAGYELDRKNNMVLLEIYTMDLENYEDLEASKGYLIDLDKEDIKNWFNVK